MTGGSALAPVFAAACGWPYVLLGFALGTIPFGLVVSRLFYQRDVRGAGSGNIGAANALRTLGTKAGLAVLALDAAKGALAVLLARHDAFGIVGTGSMLVAPLAGLAAVLGHCYTPWLRFRGGKGVATYLGATSALAWPSGLAFGLVWLAIVLPTGYASLGSIVGTALAGAVVVLAFGPPPARASAFYFAAASLLLVLWRHRENIARLVRGSENRLDLVRRRPPSEPSQAP